MIQPHVWQLLFARLGGSPARCHCSSAHVAPYGLSKGHRHQGPGSRYCYGSWLQRTRTKLRIATLCESSLKPQWHLSSLLICSGSFCSPTLTLSLSQCGSSATALQIMRFGANSKTLCLLSPCPVCFREEQSNL